MPKIGNALKVEKEYQVLIQKLERARAKEQQETLDARLRKDTRIKNLEDLLRPSQRKNTQLAQIVDRQSKLLAKREKDLKAKEAELLDLRLQVLRRANTNTTASPSRPATGGGTENSPGAWDKSFDGKVDLDDASTSATDSRGKPAALSAGWDKSALKTIAIPDDAESPVTSPRAVSGGGGASTPPPPKYDSQKGRELLDTLSHATTAVGQDVGSPPSQTVLKRGRLIFRLEGTRKYSRKHNMLRFSRAKPPREWAERVFRLYNNESTVVLYGFNGTARLQADGSDNVKKGKAAASDTIGPITEVLLGEQVKTENSGRDSAFQVSTEDGQIYTLALDGAEECDSWTQALLGSLNQVQETAKAVEKLLGKASAAAAGGKDRQKSF